eukprot:c43782_g1_i1 orf=110-796(-)
MQKLIDGTCADLSGCCWCTILGQKHSVYCDTGVLVETEVCCMKLHRWPYLTNRILCGICILSIMISADALSDVVYKNNEHTGEEDYVPHRYHLQQSDGAGRQFDEDSVQAAASLLAREDYGSFDPRPRFKKFKPAPIEHRAEIPPPIHKAPPHFSYLKESGTRSQAPRLCDEPAEEPITANMVEAAAEAPRFPSVASQTSQQSRLTILYICCEFFLVCVVLLLYRTGV